MSFREGIVYFECTQRCLPCFGKCFFGRDAGDSKCPEDKIGVGQARVSQSVTRIVINRLIEVFNGLSYTFIGAFIPTIATPEI